MKNTEKDRLHYTLCGLNYVYLLNGFRREEGDYGFATAIENVNDLHQAIAKDIIHHRGTLSGKEIRFLRTEMDLAQVHLATLLGVNAQTVARWEKEQNVIHGSADRLLRVLYEKHIGGDEDVNALIEALAALDDMEHGDRCFEEYGDGWRLQA